MRVRWQKWRMCRRTPSVAHFQLIYHKNSVHFQAEGYEIVSACWTGAGNANKPPALTAAIGNRTADFQHSVFMR